MNISERVKHSEFLSPILEREKMTEAEFLQGLAAGSIVIPWNPRHKNLKPVAIGKGATTKVSASIGMYSPEDTPEKEMEKLKAAVAAGTDSLMDLSVRGDMGAFRRQVVESAVVPVGSLPLYEALSYAHERRGSALRMEADDLFAVIERQAQDGVDFMAFHPGITLRMIDHIKASDRIDPMVSFGGSHLMGWMIHNQKENPLLEQYDRLLELCNKYDITLALADANRPGCIADSLDGPMVEELVLLGDLVKRAQKAGVQIMVKGPGHMPIHRVEATMTLEKSLCHDAPYFVFGPLLTDVAVGYDHINAAIGGALSSYYGADFLCYVTAAEHLGLPDQRQVHEGVVAARIGAHSGDIAKGVAKAAQWDLNMSIARKDLDWNKQMSLAIDPKRAREVRETRNPSGSKGCAMCGKYCAMKILSKFLSLDHVYQC